MSKLKCPFCKSNVYRLHQEGDYVCVACDTCEAHGPRIRTYGKITALCEEWAREEYAKCLTQDQNGWSLKKILGLFTFQMVRNNGIQNRILHTPI